MSQRVWLITGASAGFGRSLANAALAAGDTVVAAVRRPESVKDLAEAAAGRITVVELDVTDNARIDSAIAEVLDQHDRIDVLVNNAGKGLIGAAEDIPDEELRALMDLHLFGPAAITRAVLPRMRAQGSGAIVQLSSQAGRYSFPGISAYSATKFALEGWSEALSLEVAKFGIHVLIVEPGPFRTSFNEPNVIEFTEPSEPYREGVGAVQTALANANGVQAGDPDRAAAAIITALEAENPPLRLALGNEAADSLAESYDKAKAELAAWDAVARGADYPA
ncbi:oxidoreductase [Amycolatopsis anabasis]|uniref:oxidoreductase n=1 Tax=Amycolatopsis anabasis TaxID=1840409 RepID=UPI00131A8DEA|nr:oxidoreductase [Amycolatopsis anabasis]